MEKIGVKLDQFEIFKINKFSALIVYIQELTFFHLQFGELSSVLRTILYWPMYFTQF